MKIEIIDIILSRPWINVFEGGDGAGGGDGNGAGGDGAGSGDGDGTGGDGDGAGGDGAGASKGTKVFNQQDVNRLLANERRKGEERIKKAIEEAEALKAKASLTDDERSELESRLENMKNELLTKDELAKKEKDKLAKKHVEELEKITGERDAWQQRYTNASIERTITDASVAHEAFVPEQVVAILRPHTRLIQELDSEGNPNGNYIPKVEFADTDKDGKPVTLDLMVSEAVKRMTELDKYGNLFKGKGTGGVGGGNAGQQGAKDLKAIARDPVEYRKQRKEGKI
jgi:hypothetical protein